MHEKKLSSLLFCTLAICLPPYELSAKKIKQMHKIEISKADRDKINEIQQKQRRIVADSILNSEFRFSGYDKPAPASKETFHITNLSDSLIRKAGIRLTYLDLQNRMLHSRETEVECEIPSGETRIASIKSWDLQHTFYYYLGPEPKKIATPYKVTINLLWIEY